MRPSISRTVPVLTGLTLAALGAVTVPATARTAPPDPDPLGVSQPLTAPVKPTPPAEANRPAHASPRALIVKVTSCSESDLQAAIGAVATVGGVVDLKPRCTYTLTDTAPPTSGDNGLPVITSTVTINGCHDTIARAATAANFRFFEVNGPNGNLTLDSLTLSNGHAASGLGNGRGGAVWLAGSGPALKLKRSTLTGNTADVFGGAVDNDNGKLTVNRSTLSDNRATYGGAVFVSPYGGSGTATFDKSTIAGNHATGLAGGIAAAVGTTSTLTATRITGNDVTGTNPQGGGIAQAGTITLTRSHVTDNTANGNNAQGGGIFNLTGSVKLNDSLVAKNTANGQNSRGGGIYNTAFGSVALTRTLVTKNQALGTGANGGGVFNASGTVTRTQSPIVGNQPNNCGSPSTVTGCS